MDPSYPGGAEETDFAWRAQQAGIRVVSVPQAVVHYRLKSEPRSLFRQQRIQQRGRIYPWTRYRDSPMQGPSLKGSALEVIELNERNEEGRAFDGIKYWHTFTVIARRPA